MILNNVEWPKTFQHPMNDFGPGVPYQLVYVDTMQPTYLISVLVCIQFEYVTLPFFNHLKIVLIDSILPIGLTIVMN